MTTVKDPYQSLLPEARDLTEQLGKGILELEKGLAVRDVVQRLLRVAHTLKGAARVVKQGEVADLAHAIEDALTPHRETTTRPPVDRIEALLRLVDEITARITALGGLVPVSQPEPDEGLQTLRTTVADMDDLLDAIAESRARLQSFRAIGGTLEHVRGLAQVLGRQVVANGRRSSAMPVVSAHAPVHELLQLVGDVERRLTAGFDHVDRELRHAHQSAEQLRLVPAEGMFVSLERTARDVAQKLQKPVRFESTGGDVRVEAHVLATVQRGLLQLIRNAVAHGIEQEPIRKARRKPPTGLVTIHVARRGRQVVFQVRDDGGGVNLEAVRRLAGRHGVSDAEVGSLGAQDLIRLLLQGGISTAPEVTDVAGRGIGLDIVRETVAALRGEVTVVTDAAKGTTVELIVPLVLASVQALVVEAGGTVAAIPLASVKETLSVPVADVARFARVQSIVHRGVAIPFVPLARALRIETPASRPQPVAAAILVESVGGIAAVGVDRCVGTERVMVRPLPALMSSDPVVAGLRLDAEGTPQMVLDPEALVGEALRVNAVQVAPDPVERAPILVVDDSLTTRMLEQSILESAGYEVDAVTSAEEALASAHRKSYALFLVDVEMPGMDGFTFVERVRADPAVRSVPALLVTSRASAEDRQRGHDVGAQGYIVKSEFNQADLLARIRRLVG